MWHWPVGWRKYEAHEQPHCNKSLNGEKDYVDAINIIADSLRQLPVRYKHFVSCSIAKITKLKDIVSGQRAFIPHGVT